MPYGVCRACSWIVEKRARSCERCGQSLPFDYTKLIPAHVLDEARHCFKELSNISASVTRIQKRYPHLDSGDLTSALTQSLREDHSRIVAQPRKSLELTSLRNPRDVRAWHAKLKCRPVCVVVDIETSGLIINKVMPRVVQLAWCVEIARIHPKMRRLASGCRSGFTPRYSLHRGVKPLLQHNPQSVRFPGQRTSFASQRNSCRTAALTRWPWVETNSTVPGLNSTEATLSKPAGTFTTP
jgi:hypothetical protein